MDVVPEPWAQALRDVNAVNRKPGLPDEPSLNALRDLSGVAPTTISKLIRGVGIPKPETIEKIADALNRRPHEIAAWAGMRQTVSEPYVPPDRADWLTKRQRKAVDELILSIVEATAARAAPTDNVRALHPPKQPVDVDAQAARTAPSFAAERSQADTDQLGEDSQDPGSDEPV